VPWTKLAHDKQVHPSSSESLYEKSLVEKWMYWVFVQFLIPILQYNFYITESGLHRNRIFYYRRSVWAKIRKLAIGEMKSTLFEVLPEQDAINILKQRAFGFSYVRILPKVPSIYCSYDLPF
jgi:telomerase reverse transcriptase